MHPKNFGVTYDVKFLICRKIKMNPGGGEAPRQLKVVSSEWK